MEEDNVSKAPITRLRRRLSVEVADDAKSPTITPTKRRGKLAAKPHLDLIDENARAQVTPSTRMKSNTSIVSENNLSTASPRALRAARRNSTVESDNEASQTPTRKPRRTRKESTSSVENTDINPQIPKLLSVEMIAEETNSVKTRSRSSSETNTVSKSPHLIEKSNTKSNNPNSVKVIKNEKKASPQKLKAKTTKNVVESRDINDQSSESEKIISPKKLNTKIDSNKNIVESSDFKELDSESHPKENRNKNTKRPRTRSWMSVPDNSSKGNSFYSDSETVKKNTKNNKSFDLGNLYNKKTKTKSIFNECEIKGIEADLVSNKLNKSSEINKSNRKTESLDSPKSKIDLRPKNDDNLHTSCTLFQNAPQDLLSSVFICDSDSNGTMNPVNDFTPAPILNKYNNEDQCVPVIEHQLGSDKNSSVLTQNLENEISQNDTEKVSNSNLVNKNNSCEPMEIDETMPENITLCNNSLQKTTTNSIEKNENTVTKSPKTHSSLYIKTKHNDSPNNSLNDSKSKCSIDLMPSMLERSGNENKSTLVLSQIKDTSSNETNLSKSSKFNEILSKSNHTSEVSHVKKDFKNNLSLNDLSSTPVHKKNIHKLAMQTSTPVNIVESKGKKQNIEENELKHKSDLSVKSHSNSTLDSSSNDQGENSGLLDNEAEATSEDYESGDSQDDEEKQYLKENEIVDKGETLTTTDEEVSDEDYEKDSFVVSSNEEDNELLSGSGDDLSMSDNELTMTKKSKSKYNSRKMKEQKLASKEMYNARHNLDESNKSSDVTLTPKNKNTKRQRLDSSTLASEEEIMVKCKNNNRMRFNSSTENTVTNSSKNKSVAQSFSENEITNICNESVVNQKDPLAALIKLEPRTPQRELNISTINFTVREEVEQIQIDQNVSLIKSNETSDPLESTTSDESSEAQQIKHDYDTVLDMLNKDNSRKIKYNTSLNLNKKAQQSKTEPVIDQLNLTVTTKTKKSLQEAQCKLTKETYSTKQEKSDKSLENCNKLIKNVEQSSSDTYLAKPEKSDKSLENCNKLIKNIDESSSDTIDFRLLLPEDSDDCEIKIKKDTNTAIEDFIPIVKTKDISFDKANLGQQQSFNTSLGRDKKKKRQSESTVDEINHAEKVTELSLTNDKKNTAETEVEDCMIYFVDNVGDTSNVSLNKSQKSEKKKTKNISENKMEEDIYNVDTSLSQRSEKKKTKKTSENLFEAPGIFEKSTDLSLNSSHRSEKKMMKTPQMEKNDKIEESSIETSQNVALKKKRQRKSESESQQSDKIEESSIDTSQNITLTKKKKKKSESESQRSDKIEESSIDTSQNITLTKKKKKKSESESQQSDNIEESSIDTSQNITLTKKKKKKSESESQQSDMDDECLMNTSKNISLVNEKRKKKNSISENEHSDNLDQSLMNTSLHSVSEKKKKMKQHQQTDMGECLMNISLVSDKSKRMKSETENQQSDNSVNKKGMKKKRQSENQQSEVAESLTHESLLVSKKKKKKSESEDQDSEGNQMKKRKRNESTTEVHSDINCLDMLDVSTSRTYKEKKHKTSSKIENIETSTQDQASSAVSPQKTKRNKKERNMNKRKFREVDDDVGEQVTKIFKESSFNKVPHLPAAILNKLDDKPFKVNRAPRVISTSNFMVERSKMKRTKPSNYLEESVYLNDMEDTPEVKRQKHKFKKPKVLPFIPTAVISDFGSTTNFQVNIIPNETQHFVAQSASVSNFKNDYLYGKKIKRLGTYELYRRQMMNKISKF